MNILKGGRGEINKKIYSTLSFKIKTSYNELILFDCCHKVESWCRSITVKTCLTHTVGVFDPDSTTSDRGHKSLLFIKSIISVYIST